MSALSIAGTRSAGDDVRLQNVNAAMAIANIVKSSLGPVGLDKMLVDEVGDVTITNDGATILKLLEVEHPAAKVLCDLSGLQDQEVGDGTTSVVIIAAELLKVATDLIRQGVHPTTIIAGYQRSKKEACKYIADRMTSKVADLDKVTLLNVAKTAISSKIIHMDAEFFSKLAVNAVLAVKNEDKEKKEITYPIKAVSILKAHGRSAHESELVNGYALNTTRASQAMTPRVVRARIAILDIDLRKIKLPMGVSVSVSDPIQLEKIRERESSLTKDRIKMVLDAGANVIITSEGIDDMALKMFVEAGAIACRRVSGRELNQVAKATGATVVRNLGDFKGEESFDASLLGTAELVEECKVGDGEMIYIRGCKTTRAQTIVLRGASDFMLDEMERSLIDAMSALKRVLESKKVVPGGGAVEAALSVYLEHVADTMGSRQQLAVTAYGQALLVIPKVLASNGAYDATDLVAKLRAYHTAAQTREGKEHFKWTGLDLEEGKVRNNLKAGVLESAFSKIKMLQFATEAAVTILRIDDVITMDPKPMPKHPREEEEDD